MCHQSTQRKVATEEFMRKEDFAYEDVVTFSQPGRTNRARTGKAIGSPNYTIFEGQNSVRQHIDQLLEQSEEARW